MNYILIFSKFHLRKNKFKIVFKMVLKWINLCIYLCNMHSIFSEVSLKHNDILVSKSCFMVVETYWCSPMYSLKSDLSEWHGNLQFKFLNCYKV